MALTQVGVEANLKRGAGDFEAPLDHRPDAIHDVGVVGLPLELERLDLPQTMWR